MEGDSVNERFWQKRVAEEHFKQPLSEIVDELAERNRERDPYSEDSRPASLGKFYLYDLLEERRPDLFTRFSPKVIKACIYVAMQDLGYHSPSHRKKAFWRDGI